MNWILYIVIAYGDGVSQQAIEFRTEGSCIAAKGTIYSEMKDDGNTPIFIACIERK